MYNIIRGKQSNQFTYCDETKKRALNSQTVRAKEKKLSHGGPCQRQTPMKVLMPVSSLSEGKP